MGKRNWQKYFLMATSIIILLLVWYFAARNTANSFILPGPEKVVAQMAELFQQSEFYENLVFTILRGLFGLMISMMMAVLFTLITGIWTPFRYALLPLMTALRSTPIISLILLALIWFGSERVPVFIAFLTMFPILCSSMLDGINNTDRELITMARSFKVPKFRIFTGVYLPYLSPFFFSGLSNAMGFGWRAIIIGEVLSQPLFGIGSRMKDAQNYLMVSTLIAWTVIAILISSLFEYLVRRLEKRVLFWKSLSV